jgi:hypothetical protein
MTDILRLKEQTEQTEAIMKTALLRPFIPFKLGNPIETQTPCILLAGLGLLGARKQDLGPIF